ncbi:hypothetical protein D9M68_808930 [compost metagenome]
MHGQRRRTGRIQRGRRIVARGHGVDGHLHGFGMAVEPVVAQLLLDQRGGDQLRQRGGHKAVF